MKKISFQTMCEETYDDITESGIERKTRQVLKQTSFVCPLSTLDQNIAFVSSIAYNGEYTIVDDGQPEPAPSTESILLELAADHEARLCEIELGV